MDRQGDQFESPRSSIESNTEGDRQAIHGCGECETEERLTYPRSSGLIKDLTEIWVDPNGNLSALFG